MSERNETFAVGTTYWTRGKAPRFCTVTDVHTTFNLAGEMVSVSYVSTHEFFGRVVTNHSVLGTTIKMGLAQRRNGQLQVKGE